MQARPETRQGFTLIEMLVVITILIILVALLYPAYTRSVGWARLVKCQAGLHQLSLGWLGYAHNNKKVLILAEDRDWQDALPVPGRPAGRYLSWVNAGGGRKYNLNSIKDGALWPYMSNSYEVYRCPEDRYDDHFRSYALSTTMGGSNRIFEEPWEKHMIGRIDRIPEPATMFTFVEEDGSFADSWIMYQKGPQDPDQRTWWFRDDVAWNDSEQVVWHLNEGQSFGFADGHVEYWQWQNIHEDHGQYGYWHMYNMVNEDLHKVVRGHSPHFGMPPPLPTP